MAGAYLVVRIKGQADVPHWARTTMRLLKLEKKYRATILPATDSTKGMLKKIQTFVAWSDAEPAIVAKLVGSRARVSGYKPLDDAHLKALGYDDIESLAGDLHAGRAVLSKLSPLKPWFALAPPRYGFRKSTKRLAGQGGILGANRDLPSLVERMI